MIRTAEVMALGRGDYRLPDYDEFGIIYSGVLILQSRISYEGQYAATWAITYLRSGLFAVNPLKTGGDIFNSVLEARIVWVNPNIDEPWFRGMGSPSHATWTRCGYCPGAAGLFWEEKKMVEDGRGRSPDSKEALHKSQEGRSGRCSERIERVGSRGHRLTDASSATLPPTCAEVP